VVSNALLGSRVPLLPYGLSWLHAPDDDRPDSWFRALAQRLQGAGVEYFRRRRALWLGSGVVRLADEHSEGLFGFRRALREQV
jgi:hypothetical protein